MFIERPQNPKYRIICKHASISILRKKCVTFELVSPSTLVKNNKVLKESDILAFFFEKYKIKSFCVFVGFIFLYFVFGKIFTKIVLMFHDH